MAMYIVEDCYFEEKDITVNEDTLYAENTFRRCTIYADCDDATLARFKRSNTLEDCEIARGPNPNLAPGDFVL